MPIANIYVKNVAAVAARVEVYDLNANPDVPIFAKNAVAAQTTEGPIGVKPDPVNLDHHIRWKTVADGYPDGQDQPYVEDGQVVEVALGARKDAPSKEPAKSSG